MVDEPVVLYEERDSLAILTINRPEKMNTLTDAVIQGIADGIDAGAASPDVSSIILRGAGPTFTAGYDLNPRESERGRARQNRNTERKPSRPAPARGTQSGITPSWATT